MRSVLASVLVLFGSVASAGDVQIMAAGFPVGHRGNGSFLLKQVVNVNTGKPVECWSQNGYNDGWVASFSDNGGVLVVTYCRNGFPLAVYRVAGSTVSGQNIGLSVSTIGGQVPASISFAP